MEKDMVLEYQWIHFKFQPILSDFSFNSRCNFDISIIGNSTLVCTLNAFLNTPLPGGMMCIGNNKIIKVQGNKGQLSLAN